MHGTNYNSSHTSSFRWSWYATRWFSYRNQNYKKLFHDMVDKMIWKRETGEPLFKRQHEYLHSGTLVKTTVGALQFISSKLSTRPLQIPRCKTPCYAILISIKNWYSAPSLLQKIILNFPSTINRRENIKTKKTISTYPILSETSLKKSNNGHRRKYCWCFRRPGIHIGRFSRYRPSGRYIL